MDRVFSIDEMDQFWTPHPPLSIAGADDGDDAASGPSSSAVSSSQSKRVGMNRSSSEWAFQRYLQEASASDRTAAATTTTIQSSSSSTHPPQNDDFLEIKGSSQHFAGAGVNANQQQPKMAGPAVGAPPPNISPDSEEYQAFLKSRLELACAAVALTRVSLSLSLFFFYNLN